MLSRNRFKHLFGFWAAVFSALIVVENCHAVETTMLCKRRDFEFSANAVLEGAGPVHVNLVCMDDGTMAVSIYHPKYLATLTNASLADYVLNLSQISMAPGDRNLVPSTSSITRLHLNLQSYMEDGDINGSFLNQNMEKKYAALTGEVPFVKTGQRTFENGSLPRTSDWKETSPAIDPMKVVGFYHFPIQEIYNSIAQKWIPAATGTLIYDVGDNTFTPAIYLQMEGTYQYHLVQGAQWDGSGRFQMSTPFNDMTTVSNPFGQIRGHFLDEKTIEFYFIDPVWGLRGHLDKNGKVDGPFRATLDLAEIDILKPKDRRSNPSGHSGMDNRAKLPISRSSDPGAGSDNN